MAGWSSESAERLNPPLNPPLQRLPCYACCACCACSASVKKRRFKTNNTNASLSSAVEQLSSLQRIPMLC